jgi:uncharacterized iron-regulated protein
MDKRELAAHLTHEAETMQDAIRLRMLLELISQRDATVIIAGRVHNEKSLAVALDVEARSTVGGRP